MHFIIQTDNRLEHNKPDVVFLEKDTRIGWLTPQVLAGLLTRESAKKKTKNRKVLGLQKRLKRRWNYNTVVEASMTRRFGNRYK